MSATLQERPTAAAARALAEKTELEATLARVLGPKWRDPLWRLRNLYYIVDENGQKVRFIPNEEQEEFVGNMWFRNLILKARKLGFSTAMQLMALDQAMFNANYHCSIISHTIGHAGVLFAMLEFAYDSLPTELRQAIPIKSRTGKSSIEFDHHVGGTPAHSSVVVSVSSRGGNPQLLHVSELGPLALKAPARAAEVVSGAFASVPQHGIIVVESTAAGAFGEFYDLCSTALRRQQEGTPETALDYRLHFFPWYRKTSYTLSPEDTAKVIISERLGRYFRDLETKLGIVLKPGQRAWYAKTLEIQKRAMFKEFPSTPEEAFEAAIEGAIYGEEMATVRENGRITDIALDATYPVNTFWDLGTANTFVWLHQRVGLQHRFLRTVGDPKAPPKAIGRWWRDLEEWRLEQNPRFLWGQHFMPHDADTDVPGDGGVLTTTKELFEKAGGRNVVVVPRVAHVSTGIELTRRVLDVDCWFDRAGCAAGIRALDGYQYEWDENLGRWTTKPFHNWAAHPADAWRQFAQALDGGLLGTGDLTPSLKRLKGRDRSPY